MTDNNLIRVLICDDHDMLREGLASFLMACSDLELVGEATTGVEAISLCDAELPDVILMDLLMPELDGVGAIKMIKEKYPSVKIIALSSFAEGKLVRSALEAGATSYLLKNVSASTLAESIRVTYKGVATFSPEITPSVLSTPKDSDFVLTKRETEVLVLMVEGYSNAEIAFQLSISKFTVKNHVSNILGKLGVSSRTETVRVALQSGLV